MMGRPSVSQKAFVNSIHHSLSVYLLICTYGAIVRQQGDVCKRQLFHVVLMYHLFYFFFFLAMALLIRHWCFLRQHGISPLVQYIYSIQKPPFRFAIHYAQCCLFFLYFYYNLIFYSFSHCDSMPFFISILSIVCLAVSEK